ncbi:MAG: YkgJ family cysteine cluster protein [Desulfobacteraceae bacterium]|nr:MAG: YkgJ family cysteine cluster protein [Desulfobacteraceae bacterium]
MTYDIIKASTIFQCKKCGDCCKGYGGTYLTPDDVEAISRFIHTSPDTFIEEYCQISGKRPVIRQNKKGYCIFWDEICTIHPVKPKMCREWPFIRPVLADIRNWEIMAGSCPGIHTDFPDEVIKTIVEDELSKKH